MLRLAVLTFPLLAIGACSHEEAAAVPAGAVVSIDGVPVLASEVDLVAAEIGVLHPAFTLPQRRRSALLEVVLPRLYALRGNEEARAAALERAQEFRAQVVAAQDESELPPAAETHWRAMGVDIWLAVHELEIGVWSEPLEVPGAFVVARIVARDRAAKANAETLRMNLEIFAWVPERGQLFWEMRAAKLEILDPAWEDVVPASWKHAMSGDKP